MCAGKHASLGICVLGNNKLGETRIPATPAMRSDMHVRVSHYSPVAGAFQRPRKLLIIKPVAIAECLTSSLIAI